MAILEASGLTPQQHPTAVWASALLHALARDEAAARRPRRLSAPGLDTWNRFRGRLDVRDFVALLFEDAAVAHRIPFDALAVGGPLRLDQLPVAIAQQWLDKLQGADLTTSGADYVASQARLLGLPTRLARSDLQVIKSHHKVLELPGTGGQLAHHLVASQPGLTLQGNITVACDTWQELTLAGIVALDLAAPHTQFTLRASLAELRVADHPLRQQWFDYVVGLHPDKGGAFQVMGELAIWFGGAKIFLV